MVLNLPHPVQEVVSGLVHVYLVHFSPQSCFQVQLTYESGEGRELSTEARDMLQLVEEA